MNSSAIQTEGLTKRFGDVVAVDGVSLDVDRGEVFGFLGPNGAGKSTTIKLLLGFLRPTSGSIRVLGRDVSQDPVAVRRESGLLPEQFVGFKNLSAREHIRSAIQTHDADDDPDDIIERVGLDPDDARRPVSEYSTGMRQRAGLGVALVGSPGLLVLDEPTSGLDPTGVKRFRRIIQKEVERGAAVFFSSHILDEVEKVCDRVGILQSGQLIATDTVADLRAQLDAGAVVRATVEEVPSDLSSVRVDGVADVSVNGRTVEVECERATAKTAVVTRLESLTEVRDLTVEDVSLETLFEEYTDAEGSVDPGRGAATNPAEADTEVEG